MVVFGGFGPALGRLSCGVQPGDYQVRPSQHGVRDLRAALTALSTVGGTLRLMPGVHNLRASELARAPLDVPSGVRISGDGASLRVRGREIFGSVFRLQNASDGAIHDLTAVGNGRGLPNAASGAFLSIVQTADATRASGRVRCTGLRLENFGAERWISAMNLSPTHPLSDLVFEVQATSAPGNSPAPGMIGASAAIIFIYGVNGVCDTLRVRVKAQARHIKSGAVLFGRIRAAVIEYAQVDDAGLLGAADDAGGYALLAYAPPGQMTDISILEPHLTRPRSCGIYAVNVRGLQILDPVITGQTDRRSGTIPKAAIALNACREFLVRGGVLSSNYRDLHIIAGPTADPLDGRVEQLTTRAALDTSVFVHPGAGRGHPAGLTLVDCDLSASRSADSTVTIMNGAADGRRLRGLRIEAGRLDHPLGRVLEVDPLRRAFDFSDYALSRLHLSGPNARARAGNRELPVRD